MVQDHQGSIILTKGSPIAIIDAMEAEMCGFLATFHILKEENWLECFVEGNSQSVISWGSGRSKGSWRLSHLICEAKCIVRDFKVVVSHIPRSQNDLVDMLAKWSVNNPNSFVGDYIPDGLRIFCFFS